MNLEFHPVKQDRWADFEKFFECKGSPHNCWCMVWRTIDKGIKNADKSDKKASIKRRVNEGIHIGILAYLDNEPIAWCSIAPRETYRSLSGHETKESVWSLVCFFIKRSFRNKGFTSLLLDEAIKYARDNGAKYVEAYPVDPDSPSYRFMGFKQTFEKAKFKFIKKAGKRRNVMLLELNEYAPNKAYQPRKEYINFEDLDEFEQKWVLKDTWCDKCSKAGQGIENPVMYKENGNTFIEGKCVVCGMPQTSQIITKEVKD